MRQDAGAEAVVDVHDRHPGGAGIEHREQRGKAVEARPVSDTGRDGDDGLGDQAAHHGRQDAVHAGRHHDDVGGFQGFPSIQDPVQPRDAHVVSRLHATSENCRGHGGLFGHRNVRGARGDDQHPAHRSRRSRRRDDDGAAQRMIHGTRSGSPHGSEHLGGGAGREEGAVAFHDALGDGGDLLDRLPFAEDHLRESLAQSPMVIHPSEAHVLVGQMAELLRRLFGRDLVGANVSQELQERLAIHTSFRRGTGFYR